MVYVIGSGPSGIAVATALVKRGLHPTILDAGVSPEPAATALKSRLASVEPHEWSADDVAKVKRAGTEGSSGIPRKLQFGSNFAYRDSDPESMPVTEHASILRTFARGGFSNVWGGVLQSLPAEEFTDWPIQLTELAPHYAEVGRIMGVDPNNLLSASPQAEAFYNDLESHQSDLHRQGIHFDRARLAVRTSDSGSLRACRHCGLCLYGCPYDSIFNAGSTLTKLINERSVSYIPDVIVDRLVPLGGRVQIEARSPLDGTTRLFSAGKVFVAAGVLESARIILNSTNLSGATVQVRQSDIFTVPILRYRSTGPLDRERLTTLAQLVIRVEDQRISRRPVHLQLYGYNDIYMDILRRRVGALAQPLYPILKMIAERLFVAFGYIHSNNSSTVRITRAATPSGRLRLEGQIDRRGRRIATAVVQKLLRNRHYFQALPMWFDVRFDEPGAAHRSGACFPMRRTPGPLETNTWGVLPDLNHVHVVDASVLCSVAAGPIAFTAMANAHRIGSSCTISDAA